MEKKKESQVQEDKKKRMGFRAVIYMFKNIP